MPKSLRAAAAALAVALAITGCAPIADAGEPPARADGRPVVLTTFTVLQDIAQNVAGDRMTVESITKLGSEIHGYEPTPRDIRRAQSVDLILDNGLELEAWFERFISGLDAPRVTVSDGVDTLPITEDAYAGRANPHAWMSPLNVVVYVENIADAFTAIDPEGADVYAANAAAYARELYDIHDGLITALADLPPQKRALVTCEGAFSYLARDAQLTEKYIWAVNAEQQATPRKVAAAISFVERNDIPAVFCESTVSDVPMRQVAAETRARFGGTLYVDSLSAPDGPVPTYLELVRHTVDTLVTGLTEAGT